MYSTHQTTSTVLAFAFLYGLLLLHSIDKLQAQSTDRPVPPPDAVGRPPNITRSPENDEFGRGVVRAMRRTMPASSKTGRMTIRLSLDEKGKLHEIQVVRSQSDAQLEKMLLNAAKETSFPTPPLGSTIADRTFLVTYIYGNEPEKKAAGGTLKHPTAKEYVDHFGGTIVPPGKFEIEGHPVVCGSRPTALDAHLDDYSAAYRQFLIVNPGRFEKLSPTLKHWTFGVACGFALFGPDPTGADCYAVRRGKKEGWLSDEGVEQICTFILPTRGRYNQVPGPERCQRLRQCYREN
jgi:TonB family protein